MTERIIIWNTRVSGTTCNSIRPFFKEDDYFNTWFSGELGRETQEEFDEEGERGSSLIQTPVEWQIWRLKRLFKLMETWQWKEQSCVNNTKKSYYIEQRQRTWYSPEGKSKSSITGSPRLDKNSFRWSSLAFKEVNNETCFIKISRNIAPTHKFNAKK